MGIEFHCERCGKLIRAPRDSGGRRGKCPYCKNSVYIPTPEHEIEPLDVAPLDDTKEQEDARKRAEAIALAARLDHEKRPVPDGGTVPEEPPLPIGGASAEAVESVDVGDLIVRFVGAMRDSKLDEANQVALRLKRHSARTRDEIQRLMVDSLSPPGLEDLPPAVFKGFLNTLLQRL